MYNHNTAQQSKNRVHISWDILYITSIMHCRLRSPMFTWTTIVSANLQILFFRNTRSTWTSGSQHVVTWQRHLALVTSIQWRWFPDYALSHPSEVQPGCKLGRNRNRQRPCHDAQCQIPAWRTSVLLRCCALQSYGRRRQDWDGTGCGTQRCTT